MRPSGATRVPPLLPGLARPMRAASTAAFALAVIPALLSGQRPALSGGVRQYVAVDAPVVAITGVQLVDGTGSPARPDRTVVLRDGAIQAVGPSGEVEVPADAEVVDGAGKTLLPGWVMLHEHLFYVSGQGRYNTQSSSFPRLYLAGGATTIRTGGSMEPYTDLRIRDEIAAGRMIGPRIDVTGPYVEGEGLGIMSVHPLTDADDTRRFVTYWADEGVNSFKVYNNLSRDMLAATVEVAHARGLEVTGHLCSITYREAADLGIDNLEHGFVAATDFVDGKEPDECPRGGSSSLMEVDIDGPAFRSLVEHLIASDVALTSTLPVFEISTPGRPSAPEGALDAMLPLVRDAYLRRWSRVAVGRSVWSELLPKVMAMEKAFHDAGGTLVVGTDPTGYGGVVAGYANIRAVQLLVEAGFSFEEAVRIATLNGARYLEMDGRLGTIEAGKVADLILVDGDPVADPAVLSRIDLVFKDGYGFDSPRLFASVRGTVGIR